MPRFLLLLAFYSLPLSTFSQTNLFSNPDITWIGEAYSDYRMGPLDLQGNHRQGLTEAWNSVNLLSIQQPLQKSEFSLGLDHPLHIWQDILMEYLLNKSIPAYTDALLTTSLSDQHRERWLYSRDTVINCFPVDTTESTIFIVESQFNPADFLGIRTRQLIYYNEKANSLGVQVTAYSPLFPSYDDIGEFKGIQPMFWLPLGLKDKPGINHEGLEYIVQTVSRENILGLSDITHLKGNINFSTLLQQRLKSQSGLYSNRDGDTLTTTGYHYLLESVTDTITIFNPVTFQETVEVKQNSPAWEQFDAFRLVLRWYWIAEAKQLHCEFIGYAPMTSIKDEKGNLKYRKPLVYIKD